MDVAAPRGMDVARRAVGTGMNSPVIGTSLWFAQPENAVDETIVRAQVAADAGLGKVWLGQRFDYDAITLTALIAREVSGIGVGVSAVPIFSRHPINVAAAAQTAQAASHGRFELGLALGAAPLIEGTYGVDFRRPVRRLEEFLTIIGSLLRTGSSDFRGTEISSTTPLPTGLPGAEPVPPILVAALGPRALEVSGRLADGILPNLAGPSVLEQHIVPVVATAARESGRPEPRIVPLVPALVTDDPAAAFDQLSTATALYDTIPSYRRVLDLGGHTRAAELGLIGDARHVADGLRRYFDAGATEIILTQTATLGPDAEKRTWEAAAGVVG
ncbi:F420-dependent oxidoreductase [Gordonia bronchialis DSM 43247]|uniref:F420-dependent oxidoreductase n=2 Tax=Gordonia bronchialis TaxID=2054 RepID=D0L625_GORB4|nr:F420-dependent oxidoreductase [Gordonia bronchialis DSM 43247]STQ66510.1 Phthiodiolone/phenolphthiodiolone dimycocerosates ketoreductase [Gordonia bronchialis]